MDMSQATGTFTTSGNSVSMVATDNSTDEEDYCVKSSSLYVIAPMDMAMAGTLTGTLIFSKQ
jgi:hypothetical protein